MGAHPSRPALAHHTTTSADPAVRAERAAHNASCHPLNVLLIAGVVFPRDAGAALAATCTLACSDAQLLGALNSAASPATGRTRLMNACRQGDAARARALLAGGAGARIDAVTRAPTEKSKERIFGPGAEAGHTALLYALWPEDLPWEPREAARARREALAGLLLEAGASVQAVAGGTPPLVAAASGGYLATVRRLLAAGAEVDARRAPESRPGGRAASQLDALSQPTALHRAVRAQAFDAARLLLDAGADVNAVLYRASAEHGKCSYAPCTGSLTALDLVQDARLGESEDFALELLARGAARVLPSPTLARACEVGWLRVVRALIARGDLGAPGAGHKGMFGHALDKGHQAVCQALVSAAGRTLQHDLFGDALTYTCYKGGAGSLDLVQRFLAVGCDPSPAPSMGRGGEWHCTPLFYAAGRGAADLVQALLAAGADPHTLVQSSSNSRLHTALSSAAFEDQEGAVRELLAGGARPRATRAGEVCPLQAAALGGAPRALRLLLRAGQHPTPEELSELLRFALTFNPYGQYEQDKEKVGGLGRRDCAAAWLVEEGGARPTLEHLRAAFAYGLPLAARAIACALRRDLGAASASAVGASLALPGLDLAEQFRPSPQGGGAAAERGRLYSAALTELLVELGAPLHLALYFAALRRCGEALELLLGRLRAEPNARFQLASEAESRGSWKPRYPEAWGATPLLQVLTGHPWQGAGGCAAAVEALLRWGADPLLRAPVRFARTLGAPKCDEEERCPLVLMCWHAELGDAALAVLQGPAPASAAPASAAPASAAPASAAPAPAPAFTAPAPAPAPVFPADVLGDALLGALHQAHAPLARALLERGALPHAAAPLQHYSDKLSRPLVQSVLAVARGEGWRCMERSGWQSEEARRAERAARAGLVVLLKGLGAEEGGWAAEPLRRGWRGCWDAGGPRSHLEELQDYTCWELVDEAREYRASVRSRPVAGRPLGSVTYYVRVRDAEKVSGWAWRYARPGEVPVRVAADEEGGRAGSGAGVGWQLPPEGS